MVLKLESKLKGMFLLKTINFSGGAVSDHDFSAIAQITGLTDEIFINTKFTLH